MKRICALDAIVKRVILCLAIVSIFILSFSLYFSFLSSIKEIKHHINYQSNLVHDEVITAIDNASYVIKGISKSLNTRLKGQFFSLHSYNLIKNFDLDKLSESNIDFSSIVVIDQNKMSVASSILAPDKFYSVNFADAKCIKGVVNPYEVNIGEVSYGIYSKTPILPIGINFTNSDNEYKGSICTGIVINSLETLLKKKVNHQYIQNVDIQSVNDNESSMVGEKEWSTYNMLKHVFLDEDYKLSKQVQNMPYQIVFTLNNSLIKETIKTKLMHGIIYFIILCSLILFIYSFIKRIFMNPYQKIRSEIDELKKIEGSESSLMINSFQETQIKSFEDVHAFVQSITKSLSHILQKDAVREQMNLKNNFERTLLYYSFMEDNFGKAPIDLKRKCTLINKSLKHLLVQDAVAVNLKSMMHEIVEYISEVFELSIKTACRLRSKQKQIIRYSAFCEMVLQLMHFILRLGFIDDHKIVVEAFIKDEYLAINIKAAIIELKPISYQDHPSWPFMALHTISLLAQENHYIFNVTCEQNHMIFELRHLETQVDSEDLRVFTA